MQLCPICESSHWVEKGTSYRKKVPKKVLRYFPITSSLKRLYSSRHTTKKMRWHDMNKSKNDGIMRHPSDGEAWSHFDITFPEFMKELRNVQLGLVSDGFNPFGTISLLYTMWPMLLIPYNIPP